MVDPIAPPAADLAPAGEPSLADSALAARWREIVDRVKERKLLLGTCLEEGMFLGVQGPNVRVALTAEHSFHRAMLEMKENRDILNQEFERTYGAGATLLCVGSDQAVTGSGIRPAARGRAAPPSGLVQRIDWSSSTARSWAEGPKGARHEHSADAEAGPALQLKMSKAQEELKTREETGSSGGGKVKITMNGAQEIVAVAIDRGREPG
jgi:hypothetical protein